MKNLLYISMALPYKNVPHAGGKTFYYYIKALQDDPEYNVTLIAKVLPGEEFDHEDLSRVKFYPVSNSPISVKHPIRSLKDVNSKINPYSYYGNLRQSVYDQILNKLRELEEKPDIIVLEFTEMVLLAPKIRKLFGSVRILASEHDVSYLGLERLVSNDGAGFKKIIDNIRYKVRKKNELNSLNLCDSIMPHNFKDKDLLIRDGINADKIYILTPFFDNYECVRNPDYKSVLFYGAMGRDANSDAAIWFIENVMPKLNKTIIFTVVGSKPQERLLKYKSENVVITGFVADVLPYFEKCMCMVVPLKDGAGIKVKVLEAFTAGIPVLTNEIGIEGIRAEDKKDYLYCANADDYVKYITQMYNKEMDVSVISENECALIKRDYNLIEAVNTYKANLIRG